MDGIPYTYVRPKEKESITSSLGKKTKRFDFSGTGENELLVINLGDDQFLRLIQNDEGLTVDIRKNTKNRYHKNGYRVPARTFRLAAAKLLDELHDIDAREEARNRIIQSNFVINQAREMPKTYEFPVKTKGNESVIFYAK